MRYWFVLLCLLPLISSSPVDDLNLTDTQKEGVCEALNFSMFECVGLWAVLDEYEEEVCNYTGLVNESECNVTVVNETCDLDSKFAEYQFWKEEGFDVVPVYLDGEFSNFKIVENSEECNESYCSEDELLEAYKEGREACETLGDTSGSISSDGDSWPLWVWIGLGLLVLFVAWKKGWIKKTEEVNRSPLPKPQTLGTSPVLPQNNIPPSSASSDSHSGDFPTGGFRRDMF